MPGSVGIFSGDLDGDNDIDLAVASFGSHPSGGSILSGTRVSVLLNRGNGTFATRVTYETGLQPTDVFGADFNGDGSLDLAVTNYRGGVSVLFNNGDGTFGSKVDYSVTEPQPVMCADLDGDGDQDLVVGTLNGSVVVFLNSSIVLVPAIVVAQESIDFGEVEVGESVSQTLVVQNLGQGPLEVTNVWSALSDLSVSERTFVVPVEGSQTVTVTFNPQAEGPFSGVLEVLSDDPDQGIVQVAVSGTGAPIFADPRTDFDGSGRVDFPDFLAFVGAFETTDSVFDLDGSGQVDFGDFLVFARSFGKSVN